MTDNCYGDNGYSEQKLAGQVYSVLRRKDFTDLELSDLKKAATENSEPQTTETVINDQPLRDIVMHELPSDLLPSRPSGTR